MTKHSATDISSSEHNGFCADGTRQGQAIVEFLVGLVAVMALLIGAYQVASLAKAHTEAMITARRQAGEQAIYSNLGGDATMLVNARYLSTWDAGADNRPHTRDDQPVLADANQFRAAIVERSAQAEDWDILAQIPENRVMHLRNSDDPIQYFGLVHGYDSRTVPLVYAARRLLYNAESIQIEAEAWIPLIRGIY